jgi:hypothetical protein
MYFNRMTKTAKIISATTIDKTSSLNPVLSIAARYTGMEDSPEGADALTVLPPVANAL